MAEIPQWGRQGRRERREIARQVAKEILQGNPPKKTDALLGGLLWSTAVGCVIALFAYSSISRHGVIALCVVGALAFIAAFAHHGWLWSAPSPVGKPLRATFWIVFIVGMMTWLGVSVWPPIRRHELSQKEKDDFEKPLKTNHSEMSIHFYCAPNDEVDCEYATSLIPLFGEAGWDVANTVDRVTLSRPKPGIILGMHGSVKPEDESKLKWNQGEWTLIKPDMWTVRQAFVNVGIEPDEYSGGTIPENQINIYIGHEREDESIPTDLTRSFEKYGRALREHPDLNQKLGQK